MRDGKVAKEECFAGYQCCERVLLVVKVVVVVVAVLMWMLWVTALAGRCCFFLDFSWLCGGGEV